jgi:hypothetical protein
MWKKVLAVNAAWKDIIDDTNREIFEKSGGINAKPARKNFLVPIHPKTVSTLFPNSQAMLCRHGVGPCLTLDKC